MTNSLDNIKSYMGEYADLRKQKKALEARMKELDPLIRPALADKQSVTYAGNVFKLTTVAGRKTLDKKAVEEAGIDLEPYYKTGAPYTTLKIEEVEEL